jgi:nitroreductase
MRSRDLTPDELLSTTRTVRKRLDLTRPFERELLEECLDLAFQAPTGGNLPSIPDNEGLSGVSRRRVC